MRSLVQVVAATCFTAVVSCGPSSDPPAQTDSGTTPDVAPSFCDSDPRALTFTPGLERPGKAGTLKAKLLSIEPTRVSKGDNTWSLQLFDAAGAPVDGATITLKPFMPDHGHGSAIVPLVTPAGSDGKYAITRLNLFMPGLWEITVNAQTGATPPITDAVVFSFCVRE